MLVAAGRNVGSQKNCTNHSCIALSTDTQTEQRHTNRSQAHKRSTDSSSLQAHKHHHTSAFVRYP